MSSFIFIIIITNHPHHHSLIIHHDALSIVIHHSSLSAASSIMWLSPVPQQSQLVNTSSIRIHLWSRQLNHQPHISHSATAKLTAISQNLSWVWPDTANERPCTTPNISKFRRNGCWAVAEWNFDVIHLVDFLSNLEKTMHASTLLALNPPMKMHPPFTSPAWPFWCLDQKQTSDVLALCTWVEVATAPKPHKGGVGEYAFWCSP